LSSLIVYVCSHYLLPASLTSSFSLPRHSLYARHADTGVSILEISQVSLSSLIVYLSLFVASISHQLFLLAETFTLRKACGVSGPDVTVGAIVGVPSMARVQDAVDGSSKIMPQGFVIFVCRPRSRGRGPRRVDEPDDDGGIVTGSVRFSPSKKPTSPSLR
jgi:hypothetical protein